MSSTGHQNCLDNSLSGWITLNGVHTIKISLKFCIQYFSSWILFKVSTVSTIAVSVALANISLPFTCWHHKNIQICHPFPHLWDKFSILKLYSISSQGFTIWKGIEIDSTGVWQDNYQIQSSCCNFNVLVYW